MGDIAAQAAQELIASNPAYANILQQEFSAADWSMSEAGGGTTDQVKQEFNKDVLFPDKSKKQSIEDQYQKELADLNSRGSKYKETMAYEQNLGLIETRRKLALVGISKNYKSEGQTAKWKDSGFMDDGSWRSNAEPVPGGVEPTPPAGLPPEATKEEIDSLEPGLSEPGLPSKAASERWAQQQSKDFWTIKADPNNPSETSILIQSLDMRSPEYISKLIGPEYKKLHDIDNKLAEMKTNYDKAKQELGDKEGKAAIFGLVAHLAVGAYGIKNGIDTNGVKFNMVNWDNKYKQLQDSFELDLRFKKDQASAIKDYINIKKGALNEAQQAAGMKTRDVEKVADAQYVDKTQAYYEQKRDYDRSISDKKKTGSMAIGMFELKIQQEKAREKQKSQEEQDLAKQMSTLSSAILKDAKSDKKQVLIANLPPAIAEDIINKGLDKEELAAYRDQLATQLNDIRTQTGAKQKQLENSEGALKIMKIMYADGVAGDDPAMAAKELQGFHKKEKETNPKSTFTQSYNKFKKLKSTSSK